jgi:hypothetical protein
VSRADLRRPPDYSRRVLDLCALCVIVFADPDEQKVRCRYQHADGGLMDTDVIDTPREALVARQKYRGEIVNRTGDVLPLDAVTTVDGTRVCATHAAVHYLTVRPHGRNWG